jgi:hypothetical protein
MAPWSKSQVKAIYASYSSKGKKVPAKVKEELDYYWKHPTSSKRKK